MLGFPLLYFKDKRLMMFQLSSFYCKFLRLKFRSYGNTAQGTGERESKELSGLGL